MSEWDDLQRVFGGAVSLSGAAREAFVSEACAGREGLRSEVMALLEAHARGETFLETPPSRTPSDPPPLPPAISGVPSVPGYRIVGEIGRGGMGIVYEAERAHPKRRVALKVLRSALASASQRRRFEHEVQLLARLQHPGIAQIYDAGVAESSDGPVPFLAMELVRGRTLHEVVADPGFDQRGRLELLARIADAVQHAHQNGVIHRDLKPANILVTPEGQPKILDFGVARAIDPDLRLTTMRTEVGQLIGTLTYMSPEQVSGDASRLDTRSDVYALGVVAFELLTGRLPYDIKGKLVPEAMRVIQSEEPTRLSTMNRAFRGDVETIIAKALEKDRDRRYQSAAELGADIRRFLADEPIVARPPSRVYLIRKFAKRHKPLVASAALIAVLVTAGAIVSTALAIRLAGSNRALGDSLDDLEVARNDAQGRAAEATRLAAEADDARLEAQRRAEAARAVNEFYTFHLLLATRPEHTLGREVTMREAIDTLEDRVDEELGDQPDAAAYIHLALASVFQHLGEAARVIPHSERAIELYEASLGPRHVDTLNALNNYAQYLRDDARLEESREVRRRALETLLEVAGESHPFTLRAMAGRASDLIAEGNAAEATPLLERAIAGHDPVEGPESLLEHRMMLAYCYDLVDRTDDAESMLRTALEAAQRDLPEDHPQVMEALNGLGSILVGKGDFEGALPITRRIAAGAERVLGADHINALIARQNLARTLSATGRFDEAEPIWLDVIPRVSAQLPDPHPLRGMLNQSYGIALGERGRDRDALPYLLESYRNSEPTLGPEHAETQQTIRWLVAIYERLGEMDEAQAWRPRLKRAE